MHPAPLPRPRRGRAQHAPSALSGERGDDGAWQATSYVRCGAVRVGVVACVAPGECRTGVVVPTARRRRRRPRRAVGEERRQYGGRERLRGLPLTSTEWRGPARGADITLRRGDPHPTARHPPCQPPGLPGLAKSAAARWPAGARLEPKQSRRCSPSYKYNQGGSPETGLVWVRLV